MRQSLDTHGGIVKGGGRRDAPLHVQSMPKWELFRKFPFWRFKLSTLCRQLGATFGRLTGGGQKEATTGRPYGWVAEGWHLIRHLLRWDLIRRFAPPVHLAVPENPVGLALILGIFDRCGNSGFASSATGSAKPEFPVRGEGWKTGDRKGEAERRAPLRDQAGSIGAIGKEWFSRLSAQGTASEKKRR